LNYDFILKFSARFAQKFIAKVLNPSINHMTAKLTVNNAVSLTESQDKNSKN
jgi:hypothetical protein